MTDWVRWPSRRGSWHVVKTWTRMPGRAITLCNRTVDGEGATAPDWSEKTCESCLRAQRKATT